MPEPELFVSLFLVENTNSETEEVCATFTTGRRVQDPDDR